VLEIGISKQQISDIHKNKDKILKMKVVKRRIQRQQNVCPGWKDSQNNVDPI